MISSVDKIISKVELIRNPLSSLSMFGQVLLMHTGTGTGTDTTLFSVGAFQVSPIYISDYRRQELTGQSR